MNDMNSSSREDFASMFEPDEWPTLATASRLVEEWSDLQPDVARRYHGRPDAAAALAQKVRQGGAGAWGTVPMPPQAIDDADLRTVIGWILDRLQ